jgi:hypothetical protein
VLGIDAAGAGLLIRADGRLAAATPTNPIGTGATLPTPEARNAQRLDDYARALQARNPALTDADARAQAARWMDSPYSPLDPDLPDEVRDAMARGLDPSAIVNLDQGSNLHPRALRPAAAELYRDLTQQAERQFGNDPARMEQAYRDIDRIVREYNGILRSTEYILSGAAERDQRITAILNDIVIRGSGLLQTIGGVGLVSVGIGFDMTGIGAIPGTLSILFGLDQMYAGAQTLVNGAPARTALGTALSATMGLDAHQSELIAGLASMSPALVQSALTNPAVRTFLVERFGRMFGTNKPELILDVERTFQRTVNMQRDIDPANVIGSQGRLAEQVVREDLTALGYRNVVALQSPAGRGIDIIAEAPNGEIMMYVFEVKGSTNGVFRPLPSGQADFEKFFQSRLQRAVSGTDGFDKTPEVMRAAERIRDLVRTGSTVQGIRVNVTLPAPGTTGRPTIVYTGWK